MFWSSRWARTNFKLDYPRGATSIVFGELVRMIDNIQTETGKDIKSTLANELYSATLKRVALSSQRRQDVLSVKTLKEEISKALAEGPLPFMSENEAERLIR
jgi:hypothetical protein